MCRLGVLCTSLLSFPSLLFQFLSFVSCISFFSSSSSSFVVRPRGVSGIGSSAGQPHYSLGLCLSSSAICCYHVSTSNCSSLHYYSPWDSLCQAYACNPPPCRLLCYSASLLLFSVSGVLRFSVIQSLVREIDKNCECVRLQPRPQLPHN